MSTNPLAPPLGSIYGSIFFGTIMSTAFYSIACMQTYQNDPLRIKIPVSHLARMPRMILNLPLLSGGYTPRKPTSNCEWDFALVAALTQGFLLYRIYVFSGKKTILPLIWVSSVHLSRHLNLRTATLTFASQIIATLGLSVAAGIDVLIAVFMTFLLVRQGIATNFGKRARIFVVWSDHEFWFASTAHLLQRLIVFAVNTGTWTALFSLLTIILLHLFPSHLIYTTFVIPQCPVYCNTLLANLNARAYVGRGGTTHDDDSGLFTTPLASLQMSNRTENDEHGGEGR
ncbi:hypothetical protein EV363DRAFT_1167870 [Boletus edulis]|nr:hypothetical protein EV363DRAFT_1167870 [Boletus edulis]